MKLTVKDIKGNDQGELEVKFPLIENGKGTQAVHDAVVAYRAAQRSGTACTKTRGEVAGTGKNAGAKKEPAVLALVRLLHLCGVAVALFSARNLAISGRKYQKVRDNWLFAKRSASA